MGVLQGQDIIISRKLKDKAAIFFRQKSDYRMMNLKNLSGQTILPQLLDVFKTKIEETEI